MNYPTTMLVGKKFFIKASRCCCGCRGSRRPRIDARPHVPCERADLEADTAIAVKKAEGLRAAIETMRAEQELASARLEIEAQTEIDREEQRRRVVAAIEGPTQVASGSGVTEVVAELEAEPSVEESDNLPALTESAAGEKRSLIPALPDVAGAAARWMRPFVPPIVASAIDTDDEAAARCAPGVRGDGRRPLQPQAQPSGECDVRGDRRGGRAVDRRDACGAGEENDDDADRSAEAAAPQGDSHHR